MKLIKLQLKKLLNSFNKFDTITNFRLVNSVLVVLGLNLMVPLLMDLRGEYLTATAISIFILLNTLVVKTNAYFSNLSLSTQFKLGIVMHSLLLLSFIPYFFGQIYWFIFFEYIVAILVTMIFSAYSISLDVYQTNNYPAQVHEFKIVRNSINANFIVLGLIIAAILTYFFSIYINILVFLGYHIVFEIWLIYNWNFYEKVKHE